MPGQYPTMQYTGSAPFPQQAHLQSQQLRSFWEQQMQEIHEVGADAAEFKNHQLPLARIKKVLMAAAAAFVLQHTDGFPH